MAGAWQNLTIKDIKGSPWLRFCFSPSRQHDVMSACWMQPLADQHRPWNVEKRGCKAQLWRITRTERIGAMTSVKQGRISVSAAILPSFNEASVSNARLSASCSGHKLHPQSLTASKLQAADLNHAW